MSQPQMDEVYGVRCTVYCVPLLLSHNLSVRNKLRVPCMVLLATSTTSLVALHYSEHPVSVSFREWFTAYCRLATVYFLLMACICVVCDPNEEMLLTTMKTLEHISSFLRLSYEDLRSTEVDPNILKCYQIGLVIGILVATTFAWFPGM